jgi:hypothetical protein
MRPKFAWTLAVILALLLLAFLLSPLLARCDAAMVARHWAPMFCWSRWVALIPLSVTRGYQRGLADGGTTFYEGFGYHFTAKHRIAPLEYAEGEKVQFDSGAVVKFYLPWYKRFDFETSLERAGEPFTPNI